MIWDNKGHQLDYLIKKWGYDEEYYIWGAATSGINLYSLYGNKLRIRAFIDSDKNRQGKKISGIEVKNPNEVLLASGKKIIVASYNYQGIAQRLKQMGYVENEDFCESGQFIALHHWFDEKKIYLKRVDISVTTRCTLNCKKCNMWTPLYEHTYDKPLDMIKKDIDMLFKWVSCVERFYLLGGEVMLYPHINEVIEYIGEKYRDKIIKLQIFTNGTIKPKDKMLELMKKYNMNMIISDYTSAIPSISVNISNIVEKLNQYNIEYIVEKYDSWLDFGNPLDFPKKNSLHSIETFERCRISWRGLENGRLYFCHSDCSAKRAGLISDNANDYFDLSDYNPERRIELLEFSLGYNERGYLELCKVCWGESGNDRFISVAEQVKRKELK